MQEKKEIAGSGQESKEVAECRPFFRLEKYNNNKKIICPADDLENFANNHLQ
jgi:hypothetical protein